MLGEVLLAMEIAPNLVKVLMDNSVSGMMVAKGWLPLLKYAGILLFICCLLLWLNLIIVSFEPTIIYTAAMKGVNRSFFFS